MTDPCKCSCRQASWRGIIPLSFSSATVPPYDKVDITIAATRPYKIVSVIEIVGL